MNKRASGILLHITSLPDELTLGNFSAHAYEFVRFLQSANCKWWQVLPFNHCNYGESPYSSFSAFAGNPYFIDLRQFLSYQQLEKFGLNKNKDKSNYRLMQTKLDEALFHIYENNKDKYDLSNFKLENKYWLADYAVYMTIRNKHKVTCWRDFPTPLKTRNKTALKNFMQENLNEINYHIFLQYIFFMQWKSIKDYANKLNIKIMGDLPIYLDISSCDIWTHPQYFQLNKNGEPTAVAGTPPDYFCKNGQLWGMPLYNYKVMAEDNYDWFIKRIKHNEIFFDALRLDHFAGFVSYWSVPAGSKKSKEGKYVKGPGMALFNEINKNCKIKLVVEDLGYMPNEVLKVKQKTELPGIKIMQYGFDQGYSSEYLPHSFEKKCVAYLGNHDNDTYKGFLNKSDYEKINRIKNYLDIPHQTSVDLVIDKIIRCLYASVANIVIFTPQDLLKQDTQYRINIPGTVLETNWKYQLDNNLDNSIANMLKYYSQIFDR